MLQTSKDPYKSVFEVREEERPPTPYGLLLLPILEMNREKIKRAAERARFRLDSNRDLEDALRARLKVELDDAIESLLRVDRKSLLDAALKRKAAGAIEPPENVAVGSFACAKCEAENNGRSQFCQQCGAGLWSTCTACRTVCHASQAFCSDCGVNLQEADRKTNAELIGELERAVGFAKDHEFDRAGSLLRKIALVEDPRFDDVCCQALEWISKLEETTKTAEANDEEAIAKARTLIDERNYAQAAKVLEAQPEKLRSKELSSVLLEAKRRRDELEDLRRDITTAIQSKQLQGLAVKLERLHDVSPEPDEASKLEQQLAKRFLALAKKCFAANQYDRVIRLLDDIPRRYRDKSVRALEEKTQEFSCLHREVAQAAAITPATKEMAKKLLAMVADDSPVRKAANEIIAADSTPRSPFDAFASTVQKDDGPFGKPVRWFGRTKRVAVAESAAKKFDEYPSIWFSAIGLALEGLGEAAVPVNIAPSKGFLSGLLGGGRGKRRSEAWGMDFGNHAIKLVRLQREADQTVTLSDAFYVEHSEDLNQPQSEHELHGLIAASLDRLTESAQPKTPVCLGLPPNRVLARFFQLPPGASSDKDLMTYEARRQFPMSLDELFWSYHIADHGEDAAFRDAVLVASRQDAANELLEPMQKRKLNVDSIQSSALGLHNYIVYDYFHHDAGAGTSSSDPPVVVLDIGASMSTLLVCSPRRPWQLGVHLGGLQFTNAMTGAYGVTFSQAEKLKAKPWLAKQVHKLMELWDPTLSQFVSETQRSLGAYAQQFPDAPQHSAMIGVGGGINQHGLFGRLRGQ